MAKKLRFPENLTLDSTIEIRSEGERTFLVGTIPYNAESLPLFGDMREVIKPGAFTKTLAEAKDIVALVNHNADLILGRTRNKSLELEDTPEGLRAITEVPNTQYARDAVELIQKGIAPGLSFGFKTMNESRSKNIRELTEVRLHEISFAVPFPAYESADSFIQLRSIFEAKEINLEDLASLMSKEALDDQDKINMRNIVEKLSSLVKDQHSEPEAEAPTQAAAVEEPIEDYSDLLLQLT